MTDFFKNHPMALRHCLLYEYLRKSRVERIFDAFSMVFGDDVIKKEELLSWFNQFKQGIIDKNDVEEPITDMREVFRNDKYATRVCILYDSIKYKLAGIGFSNLLDSRIELCPSFFIYNNFCDVLGYNVMEYQEFDFWFYRFLNGKFDWSFERDKDKRIFELSDMPIDVMENIVKYLGIFDRINLAKASRSLQTFVEDQKLFHHTVKLRVFDDQTTISFDESVVIQYKGKPFGCKKTFKKSEIYFRDVPHWKQAFLDSKSILKNPKLYLDTLEIGLSIDGFYYQYFESLENVFTDLEDALKFTHRLNVKTLRLMGSTYNYLSEVLPEILPSLKPGYLSTIQLNSDGMHDDSMRKVFEMEQWKQTKYFRMYDFFMWPLHHLYHFKEFTVRLEELSVEDIRQMKKTLLNSPNFEKCVIMVDDDINTNAIEEEFGDYILQGQDESKYGKIYHYPVPNSTGYFEINTFARMAVFFKNNPIALRNCIRFEILQGNSIEQAFSNFCAVLGEEVIDYKKFKIRFNHFLKKKFNDKEGENPCAKIVRNDKYALRVCILYESIKNKLNECVLSNLWPKRTSSDHKRIFSIYTHFCNVVGEDVMEYPEFEFWFYRFNNGEFDLSYERNKEKKVYELMDMPVDVMENVVEYLDIFDRIKLTRTSRSLQTFVEDQKLFHRTMKLTVFHDRIFVSFGVSVVIKYTFNYTIFKNHVINIQAVRWWKRAFLDFTSVLKNPKLHLETLEIESNVGVLNDLEDAFKFIHYINVKKLILRGFFTNIIPSLKPGYLLTINISSHIPRGDTMNSVFETEQWKQAKCFTMTVPFFIWPLRHLFHFKKFTVTLNELSAEDIRQMKEVLFKSPDFEKCSLSLCGVTDMLIFYQEFGNALREDPFIYHYSVPNSADYFELKVERHFFGHLFEVTRKKI